MEPIPGRLVVLVVRDEAAGEFATSLIAALRRRGVGVHPEGPWQTRSEQRAPDVEPANCIVVLGYIRAETARGRPVASPSLLIVAEDATSEWGPVAPFAAVVRASASGAARPLMLFLLKFLYELDLHSADAITAEMLRFSHFKALRIARRRYPELSSELLIG